MADAGNLAMVISANPGPFIAGMGQATAAAQNMGRSVIGTFSQLNIASLASSRVGNLLGANITAGILPLVNSVADGVSNALFRIRGEIKASERLGLRPEFFQGLLHGFHLDPEEVERPLIHFQRTLQEAQIGNRDAIRSFERLGVSASDIGGLDTEHALLRVADGLHGMEAGAARTFAGFQLFGRGGQELLRKLARGADGVTEALRHAESMGHVLSESQRRDAMAATQAWVEAKSQVEAAWTQLATAMAPILANVMRGLAEITNFIAHPLTVPTRPSRPTDIIISPDIVTGTNRPDPAVIAQHQAERAAADERAQQLADDQIRMFSEAFPDFAPGFAGRFFARGQNPAGVAGGSGFLGRMLESAMPQQATQGQSAALQEGSLAAQELNLDIQRLNDRLRDETTLMNQGAHGADMLALAQRGATDAQLAEIRALDIQNDMMRQGQQLFNETRTPLERYQTELDRLQVLYEEGTIDADLFARGVMRATDALDRHEGAVQFAGAAQFGSQEAASAIIRAQFGDNVRETEEQRIRRLAEQARDRDADRNQRLLEIRELLRNNQLQEVLIPG